MEGVGPLDLYVDFFESEKKNNLTFHDGGRYHIETSPLICAANHWTGFYIIMASVMKGLNEFQQAPARE